ncbi:MAG TPA: gliding motility protein GldN [Flavisolibacter sp.]|nr:gliding motility protein GldN [Flavisolibacter sp.]
MKRHILKFSLAVILLSAMSVDAAAQRRRNTRGGNPPANAENQQQNNNNTTPPSNFDPMGNIPLRIDSSGAGGLDTSIKKGLRPDGAFDRSEILNQRTPLPYEHLRWDDALYAEKVWRELDLREKMNQPFRYNAKEDNGDQQFISILLNAVRKGDVLAFEDERFTQPLTLAQVQEKMGGGGADTTNVTDVDDPSKIVERVVTPKTFNTKSVMKLRIKEEWVFDREASRMFVRIVGICPLKTEYIEGTTRERGQSMMFWIYYPDLRPTLARYDVYNSKNMGASRMTWEELFESRMFSSYIIKSTLDNPSMKTIAGMIKDPILRLLEGDNIKERIFNYEQDLWSY